MNNVIRLILTVGLSYQYQRNKTTEIDIVPLNIKRIKLSIFN